MTLQDIVSHYDVVNDCWEWRGCLDKGYAKVRYNSKNQWAYKVIYEALVGPVPTGAILHHKCENKKCVRPDHLEITDRSDHMFRHNTNKLKEFCKRGHPLSGDNVYLTSQGSRQCKTCDRERVRIR